jgi:DUF4097 and DUF4098 domain-containing protein YvlB
MTRRRLLALALLLLCGIAVQGGSRISIANMGGDIALDDAPFGASLHTMGGNIRIGRAGGGVVAKTMGGNIAVDALAGTRLDAGTMGGDIRVRVVGSGGGRDLALHTMGGTVELIVPRDFDATFLVEIKQSDESPNSRIESDIPLSQTVTEHSMWFRGRHQTIVARKTTSKQPNHVEISTYANRVVIRRE